jgi:hypothetical protein
MYRGEKSFSSSRSNPGIHAVIVLPDIKIVIVERLDTDGATWPDPEDAGMALA